MAVRLQIDNGTVKTYRTSFGIDYADPPYLGEHGTKCGMKWVGQPNKSEECSHLECAIWANRKGFEHYKRMIKFVIIFGILCGLVGRLFWPNLILFGEIVIAVGLMTCIDILKYHYKSKDLVEFRDKGTIKGVRAIQVS